MAFYDRNCADSSQDRRKYADRSHCACTRSIGVVSAPSCSGFVQQKPERRSSKNRWRHPRRSCAEHGLRCTLQWLDSCTFHSHPTSVDVVWYTRVCQAGATTEMCLTSSLVQRRCTFAGSPAVFIEYPQQCLQMSHSRVSERLVIVSVEPVATSNQLRVPNRCFCDAWIQDQLMAETLSRVSTFVSSSLIERSQF